MGTPTAVCYRGAATVTADLEQPPSGRWTATVAATDGTVLGERDLLIEGDAPAVQFGVVVADFRTSRLTLRDEAGREVASAEVAPTDVKASDCKPAL
jgi:hypothetical protein